MIISHVTEQRIGLFIIGLYIAQLVLGLFIHYIRIPFPAFGHRPPQNFLHAVQGLVILGLANYQVRLCRRFRLRESFFSHPCWGARFTTAYTTNRRFWLLTSESPRSAPGRH